MEYKNLVVVLLFSTVGTACQDLSSREIQSEQAQIRQILQEMRGEIRVDRREISKIVHEIESKPGADSYERILSQELRQTIHQPPPKKRFKSRWQKPL